MRVLHVATVFQTADILLRGLLRYQAELGYEVSVACNATAEQLHGLREREALAGAYSLHFQRTISPWSDLRVLLQLVRVLRRGNFDVVHHSTPKAGLLTAIATRACRVPRSVHTLRGLPHVSAIGLQRRILRFASRLTVRWSDTTIVISPSLAEVALKESVITERDRVTITTSSNGLDTERFYPVSQAVRQAYRRQLGLTDTTLLVLAVGRVCRDKGSDELIDWASAYLPKNARVELWFVGAIEDPSLPQRVPEELLQNRRLRFIPPREDLHAYYCAADLLAFPSRREGFGNVVVEAAACGLPAVAYDIPGVRDSASLGRNAVLVPAGDATAFSTEVEGFLSSPRRRSDIRRESPQEAANGMQQTAIWRAVVNSYSTPEPRWIS